MSEFQPALASAPRPILTGPAERQRVIALLRAMESMLRARGLRRLRLFGSVARGEANLASDVDLIGEIEHTDPPGFSLIDLIRLEEELSDVARHELGQNAPSIWTDGFSNIR